MKTVNNLGRLGRQAAFFALLSGLAHAGPMQTAGQFEITPAGAVGYSIPVQVPPGTAGIEPKLALNYSSQNGNGLLGMGWSLSGLSAITRCPRTLAQDGVKGGVNFDANDRYCIDGQRLIAVSGVYGANGTEYRTERESFSKVVSYGAAGNGPAWFKVWTKAGQVVEYGNTADSRIEAQGKTSARAWAINKLSDTAGNYLTVSYTEDGVNGDYIPNRIDYTGNANGLTPNNAIQFTYETRPDIVPLYYAGSLIKSGQRLAKIQTVSNAVPTREYRLAYGAGATTSRSRIAGITECALPDNACKPAVNPAWSEYGSNAFNSGSSWTTLAASFLADINGDGKADFIAQQSDGLYAALSTGSGAGASGKWIASFGSAIVGQGYSFLNVTPLFFLDIDGDGLADVIGIQSDGVYVALSRGTGFNVASKWSSDFGTGTGWTNMDTYPRTLADINGDGRPDVVGFKSDGVYVALNNGAGFGAIAKWSGDFGTASAIAYSTNSANPRLVQDVNGDGLPDIVGFANGGTYVALNTGTGLAAATLWLADFGVNAGYTTQDTYPRALADVNGDGLSDLAGFKSDGIYVAINTGTGFLAAAKWLADFGTATAIPYTSQKGFPRYLADVNGDGKSDIVGFAANGVQVALSTGIGFNPGSQWVSGFGSAAGYTTSNLRQLADLDGDGYPDVVGTLASGATVGKTARTAMPDLVTSLPNGLGAATNITYGSLTNSSLYTRGREAVYPQADLMVPWYVVSSVRNPNALGSGYTTTNYQYGGLRVDFTGRGLLGFGWVQATNANTTLSTRTSYRQDWPYQGLPWRVERQLPGQGAAGFVGLTNSYYDCLNPQSGGGCTLAAGNRYFPYVKKSVESSWDANGAVLPDVTTVNAFDSYGNATQITVATADGYSKTTTNTYTNDTANWFLGRLTRSVVASTTGAPPSAPQFDASGGAVTFSGGYKIHTFRSGGTFTPIRAGSVEYLVVAGGGGGCVSGGGAGGVLAGNLTVSAQAYGITVGAGGGGCNTAPSGNSVFSTVAAIGGGNAEGYSGGSGGGSYGSAGGAGTAGQGYKGGGSSIGSPDAGPGGGGAGGAAANIPAYGYGTSGGIGVQSSISGVPTYYGGGGGGGGYYVHVNPGGLGGGGYGGWYYTEATAGAPNTGGGGGGHVSNPTVYPKAGGSGIVIIRYPI